MKLFPILLAHWTGRAAPNTGGRLHRHKRDRQQRRLVPRLEVLEDRTVLSTFTVMNTADSGAGSLRQAILNANANPGADVINFASGLTGTILSTSGPLGITDSLTIKGPGAAKLTVSGNGAAQVFVVAGNNPSVKISQLQIANGVGDDVANLSSLFVDGGGALANLGGNVTVSQVIFNNNVEQSNFSFVISAGGAIANVGTGSNLTVDSSTFISNQAVGFIAEGGAVANLLGATSTVTNSTFSKNQAVAFFLGFGGAIANDAGSTLSVVQSTFTANTATAAIGGDPSNVLQGTGAGGAVTNAGGSQLTVSWSSFSGNLGQGGNGANGPSGSLGGYSAGGHR
jgi:hypothetical protein